MRPSEKFEAKAAGQKCSEPWFSPRLERFWLTTQASGFAAGRNRAGYLDRLLASSHNLFSYYLSIVDKSSFFLYYDSLETGCEKQFFFTKGRL